MTRTLSWVLSLFAAAAAASAVTLAVTRPAAPPPPGPDVADLDTRVQRLESGLPRLERSMVQAGVRLGAAAVERAEATPARTPDDEGTPEGDAREDRQAAARGEKERQHYARLDQLARAGDGAAAEAQLRKNVEELRARPKNQGGVALEVVALDCGKAVCRVELRLEEGQGPTAMMAAAKAFTTGMGGALSMPPGAAMGRPVFYISTPGHRLPRLEP
jgi:hypothetical protein